jgi:hypothetical protein
VASYDSADLLALFLRDAGIPSTTEFPTTAQAYTYLRDGQSYYYGVFATHCPWYLMAAPTLLTSSDSGVTYVMPSSTHVLAVEVYDSLNGRLLRPCSYWDRGGDYVWEGNRIRMPGSVAKTFSGGPYVRYIAEPTDLEGSTAPTLMPDHARVLIVAHAVTTWAGRGGMRDARPFKEAEKSLAWGDPDRPGDIGIIGALKLQNPFLGSTATSSRALVSGLQAIDTGAGYSAL